MSAHDEIFDSSNSRDRKPELSGSSNESVSQPSPTMSSFPVERPTISDGNDSDHDQGHSSEQHGNHHSSRSSQGGQRPPSTMRPHLLVSTTNANPIEILESTSASSSSSSAHMSGIDHNTDDDQQQQQQQQPPQPGSSSSMSNGGSHRSKKSKKKRKKEKMDKMEKLEKMEKIQKMKTMETMEKIDKKMEKLDKIDKIDKKMDKLEKLRQESLQTNLLGWDGEFPVLSVPTRRQIDNNSDVDTMAFDEMHAFCKRGLLAYPPKKAQGLETAAAAEPAKNPQPQQHQAAATPSPMSSPVASSLSENSELNRTPGRKPEPVPVPVPESERQQPRTSTSTNLTRMTAWDSFSCETTATSIATTSVSGRFLYRAKTGDKKHKQKHFADASSSSVAVKRHGTPLEGETEEQANSDDEFGNMPPSSKRHKSSHKQSSGTSHLPSKMRSKSLNLSDMPQKPDRASLRFNSDECLYAASHQKSDSKEFSDERGLSSKPVAKEAPLSPSVEKADKAEAVPPPPHLSVPANEPLIDLTDDELQPEVSSNHNHTSTLKLKATDTFYRLPFAFGWKRELVLPSKDNPSRRSAEVFFISPGGRKLSSRKDIVPLLGGGLTIDHFCFQRCSQKADPEFELVRRATSSEARSHHNEPINGEQDEQQQVTMKRVSKAKVAALQGTGRVSATSTNGESPISRARSSRTPRRSPTPSKMPEYILPAEQEPQSEPEAEPEADPEAPAATHQHHRTLHQHVIYDVEEDMLVQCGDDTVEIDDSDGEVMANASILDIGGEVELAGQQSPAQQTDNNTDHGPDRMMDIYVINGRKYIRCDAGPPQTPIVKLVPRQADLSEYDRYYQKRIRDQKLKMAMIFSVNEAQFGDKMINAILKTLSMKDRVNISNVCNIWAMFARDNSAWNRVILCDTEVKSWRQLLSEMARHRTTELDMMGVIMSDPKLRLTGDMRILKTLRVLRTDPTTNTFLKLIQTSLPQLKELRSTCVSSHMQLGSLEKMEKLRVLRLRMTHPKAQAHYLDNVASLKCLTELSICGVTNMDTLKVKLLKNLTRLEVLSLGSCENLNNVELGQMVLPHLKALRTLRIENDHRAIAIFPVDEIMRGVALAGSVKNLELINVDVDGDFSQLLAECSSVVRLLLTPKCLQNAATMINAVMEAIRDNANHLYIFRLGLVTQLLRATENLINGTQKDVIPVQRPVPGIEENDDLNFCTLGEGCREDDHGQCVAFLPVDRLDAILHAMMPGQGKAVSVAKVAMSETTTLKFLPRDDNDDTVYKSEKEKNEENET